MSHWPERTPFYNFGIRHVPIKNVFVSLALHGRDVVRAVGHQPIVTGGIASRDVTLPFFRRDASRRSNPVATIAADRPPHHAQETMGKLRPRIISPGFCITVADMSYNWL